MKGSMRAEHSDDSAISPSADLFGAASDLPSRHCLVFACTLATVTTPSALPCPPCPPLCPPCLPGSPGLRPPGLLPARRLLARLCPCPHDHGRLPCPGDLAHGQDRDRVLSLTRTRGQAASRSGHRYSTEWPRSVFMDSLSLSMSSSLTMSITCAQTSK